jgi:hypothetical protein
MLAACRSDHPPGGGPVADPPRAASAATPVAAALVAGPRLAERPVVLASDLKDAARLLACTDDVAYVVHVGNAIDRIPLTGGPAVRVATLPATVVPSAIAASSDGLYVATVPEAEGQHASTVLLVPADGGPTRELVTGYEAITHLAIDDERIYFPASKPHAGLGWWLVSALRRTGKDVRETSAPPAADLRGVVHGAGVLVTGLEGIVVAPFTSAPYFEAAPARAPASYAQGPTSIAGDYLAAVDQDFSQQRSTIRLISLVGPHKDEVLATVPTRLDSASMVASVVLYGADVYYGRMGSISGGFRDGALVRLSTTDKRSTEVLTGLDDIENLVATRRGLVWLHHHRSMKGVIDGELMLLPTAAP